MELDLPGGVVQAQEEATVEAAGAGWEVTALGLALAAVVSALIVALGCPIKEEHLATI